MIDEWQRDTISTPEQLRNYFPNIYVPSKVIQTFPMRVSKYYASLIKSARDPIWLQAIPDERELDTDGFDDPLNEDENCPVPNLTHRYPDRVLLLVTNQCAMYCRFCTRKRKVGNEHCPVTSKTIQDGIDYVKHHPEVRDVIVSGGDPFTLPDHVIDSILSRLRAIEHVQIIRIHTRIPVVLPQRITPELCSILKKYHPLYINTHFNSPIECTEEAKNACSLLADAGISLGNQSVLLKGVNDDPFIMRDLCHKLLMMRVRPYYLYQADLVRGIKHLRTELHVGTDLIRSLRGHTSGMAVPQFVVDSPGGGGKVPISPNYIVENTDNKVVFENFEGRKYFYNL